MTAGQNDEDQNQGSGERTPAKRLRGMCAATAYGLSSVGIAFLNKILLNTYEFKYEFFIMTSQMLVTFLVLETLRLSGKLSFERFDLSKGASFIGPSIAYGLNSILALTALSGMNIPMYSMVKRCTPFITMVIGTCLLKKGLPPVKVTTGVVIITIGCIVAGFGDLAFDTQAYLCGGASVFLQAVYLLLLQRISQGKIATSEITYINSVNTFPIMLICSFAVGDFLPATRAILSSTITFKLLFLVVISMGCILNYLLFLCTNLNSALTTTVVGTLKATIQTIIGLFTFGGIDLNIYTVSGMMMNTFGGALYCIAKYLQYQNGNNGSQLKPTSQNPSKS